ncbi:hypothetical protein VWN94_10590, partial [Campylobacter coli]|nr:hypothetical protein [Campylobacter coli]
ENFLKKFKDEMDMFLIFQSSSLNDEKNVTMPLNFKPLYRNFLKLHQGFIRGLYDLGENTKLFVSSGAGFWGPSLRVFAPNEIV